MNILAFVAIFCMCCGAFTVILIFLALNKLTKGDKEGAFNGRLRSIFNK